MGFGAGVLAAAVMAFAPTAALAVTVVDAVPWPLLLIVAIWLAVGAAFLAVLRAAGAADRRAEREALDRPTAMPPLPPFGSEPRPPVDPLMQPVRRFERQRSGDALTDLGPPDVDRLVALTGQVLGADACELREQDDHAHHSIVGDRPWPATASTPLVVRGRMCGALAVASAAPDRRFGTGDLELLGAMSELVAATTAATTTAPWPSESVRAQLEALIASMTGRDEGERRRTTLTAAIARVVADRLVGEDPRAHAELVLAARLHDVGMLRVPRARLQRPGPLDPVDARLVEGHPAWGSEIVAGVPGLAPVAAIVRFHQERPDGRGYPHGLHGGRIPLASRAVGACVAWGAIVGGGPHAAPRSPEQAIAELRRHAGTQFDPGVVEAIAASSSLVPVLRVPA